MARVVSFGRYFVARKFQRKSKAGFVIRFSLSFFIVYVLLSEFKNISFPEMR